MRDETKRLGPGDRVDVYISDEEPGTGAETAAADDRRRRGGAFTGIEEDDILVFRKGSVTFYDLGTRLRSTPDTVFDYLRRIERGDVVDTSPHDGYYNEYLELNLEVAKNINSFGLTLSEIAPIEAELLAHDPLGVSDANGSGRKIPNCAQLPYGSEWLYTDAVLHKSGSSRHALSSPGRRANVDDAYNAAPDDSGSWKQEGASLEGERWNSLNVSNGAVGDEGILRKSVSGSFLRIESLTHFEVFDTGDASLYKWTKSPSFSAADEGTFTLGKTARVFLRPRIQHTAFGYVQLFNTMSSLTVGQSQVLTRFPFYPLTGKLIRGTPFGAAGNRMVITRGFSRSAANALERSAILKTNRASEEAANMAIAGASSFTRYNGTLSYTGGMGFNSHSQPVVAGMLVGIVETGGDTFYGWARQAVDTNARTIFTTGDSSASLINGASLPTTDWQCPPMRLYTGADDTTTSTTNPSKLYQT